VYQSVTLFTLYPTHLLDVRSAEDVKVLGGQVASPGVKDLDHLSTCISLHS
jgi:hypothetical protein